MSAVKGVEVEDEEYEVETILAKEKIDGAVFYFIKWKGFTDEWNTWEPESIMDCPEKVKEFEENFERERKRTRQDHDDEDVDVDDQSDLDFGSCRKKRGLHSRSRLSARKSAPGGGKKGGMEERQRKRISKIVRQMEPVTVVSPTISSTTTICPPASTPKVIERKERSNSIQRPNIRDARPPSDPVSSGKCEPRIVEIAVDPSNEWIVHYYHPVEGTSEEDAAKESMMLYYSEFKGKFPGPVIDFFERFIHFGQDLSSFQVVNP